MTSGSCLAAIEGRSFCCSCSYGIGVMVTLTLGSAFWTAAWVACRTLVSGGQSWYHSSIAAGARLPVFAAAGAVVGAAAGAVVGAAAGAVVGTAAAGFGAVVGAAAGAAVGAAAGAAGRQAALRLATAEPKPTNTAPRKRAPPGKRRPAAAPTSAGERRRTR